MNIRRLGVLGVTEGDVASIARGDVRRSEAKVTSPG